MPATMANVYVASEDMLVNRPQELRAALAVIYKTLAYMQANRAWSLSYLKDFAKSDSDDVLGKMKVSALLEAMPGVGKVRAAQIMERLEIAPSRRLRGLGDRQRKALLAYFES